MTPTKAQLKSGLEMVLAVTEAIRNLGQVPSGELYARLMGALDFEAYQKLIRIITNTGLVKESGHMLVWAGPSYGQ